MVIPILKHVKIGSTKMISIDNLKRCLNIQLLRLFSNLCSSLYLLMVAMIAATFVALSNFS